MSKRLTIRFVKSEFEKEEYSLLSTVYTNAFAKLDYICSNGHLGSIRWNDWQQGKRCSVCAGKIKPTIDFIKSEFEKDEYECLSTEYVNTKHKLHYICPKGHKGTITWGDWKQGYRCLECSGKKKHTLGFITGSFEKDKYRLKSKEYINSHSKLEYICPNGHVGSSTWSNWNQGYRCKTCDNISRLGSGNSNWKGGISEDLYCIDWTRDLKEFVKERDGYRCLNPYCNSEKPNSLSVHHINYNKKLCGPENLITICRSCNSKANFDRVWQQSWYETILNRRYGYIYSEFKDEKGGIYDE